MMPTLKISPFSFSKAVQYMSLSKEETRHAPLVVGIKTRSRITSGAPGESPRISLIQKIWKMNS